jgi:glycosyltransferase involved in cell wall biosynthesis
MESLACGTPVIASRVGGIPDILVSPDFGMMVPPADSEALAHAMLEAIDKPVNKEKILAYGQTHTWNERIKQLLSLYQSVLGRHIIPHPHTKAKR